MEPTSLHTPITKEQQVGIDRMLEANRLIRVEVMANFERKKKEKLEKGKGGKKK